MTCETAFRCDGCARRAFAEEGEMPKGWCFVVLDGRELDLCRGCVKAVMRALRK